MNGLNDWLARNGDIGVVCRERGRGRVDGGVTGREPNSGRGEAIIATTVRLYSYNARNQMTGRGARCSRERARTGSLVFRLGGML